MSSKPIQIVWFKRDLRVHDHRALVMAARQGPVLPLFIAEPETKASRGLTPIADTSIGDIATAADLGLKPDAQLSLPLGVEDTPR